MHNICVTGLLLLVLLNGCLAASKKSEFYQAMKIASKKYGLDMQGKDRLNSYKKNLASKAVPIPSNLKGSFKRDLGYYDDAVDDDAEVDWGNFGFDVSLWSLKYSSCATINFFDGNGEQEEDGPTFRQTSFVTFRLCETDTCSDNSWYGCTSDYGEYMVTLEDYLEARRTYQEETIESFCEYCRQCIYFETYFYGNRNLDEDADGEEEQHACKYYNTCLEGKSSCDNFGEEDYGYGDAGDDNVIEFEYGDFFECERVDGGDDNNEFYLGPYCDPSDHKTIKIGIFSDEWCTNYIGNKISIYQATGMLVEDDGLKDYYSSDCISCKESDLPYQIVANDQEDEDEIIELCEQIYESAAKCNAHMPDAQSASYLSYAQLMSETMVCDFIEDVVKGSYDQNGFMFVDTSNSEVPSTREALKKVLSTGYEEVTTVQVVFLVLFSVGCVSLSIVSCFLRRNIDSVKKVITEDDIMATRTFS